MRALSRRRSFTLSNGLLPLWGILTLSHYASAAIRCASTKNVLAGLDFSSADQELRQISLMSPDGLPGRPEAGGYASRTQGLQPGVPDTDARDYRAPSAPRQPERYEDEEDDYRLYRKQPKHDVRRDDEEADFKPPREGYRNNSAGRGYDDDDYPRRPAYRPSYDERDDPYYRPREERYRPREEYGPYRPYDDRDDYYRPGRGDGYDREDYGRPGRGEPYDRDDYNRPGRGDGYDRDDYYRPARGDGYDDRYGRPREDYYGGRDDGYYRPREPYSRRPPPKEEKPELPPTIYERDKADFVEDRRGGKPTKPIYDEGGDQDNCPIETRETISNHSDLPLTSASAIISTPIGDFIMYCAQAPAKAILTYPLFCSGFGDQSVGKEVLYTAIDYNCYDIRVVDDLTNLDKPMPMVIALSQGEFSSVFRVDYETNQFRLQPCKHVIEHKYITDVAIMPIPEYGAMLAFSNNDPRKGIEYQDTIAPVFLAHAGDISLCGYVDLQHTTDVTVTRRKSEIILAYLQRVGNTRRSIVYLYEVVIRNGKCDVKPRRVQSTIGSAPYRGERNTLGASEPFSIDQVICGAEDIALLRDPNKGDALHLAVAIANKAREEHGVGCPDEEKVCPDGDMDKCFCGCVHANRRSFVLAYRTRTKMFDFLYDDEVAMQELPGGPNSVVEITHLPTENCCMVFQTISPLGATELYTLEYDVYKKLRVYRFFKHGLPFYAERSSFGYCDNNDLIISYSIHNYQSENSVYHLKCNKDRDKHRRGNNDYAEKYLPNFSSYRYPSSYLQDRLHNRTFGRNQDRPIQLGRDDRNASLLGQLSGRPSFNQTRGAPIDRYSQASNRTGHLDRYSQSMNRTGVPSYQSQPPAPMYQQPHVPVKPLYSQPVYQPQQQQHQMPAVPIYQPQMQQAMPPQGTYQQQFPMPG